MRRLTTLRVAALSLALSLAAFHLLAPAADLSIAPAGPGVRAAGADLHAAPYTVVRLKPTGTDPDTAVVWLVFPVAAVSRDDRPDDLLAFTAPPGRYDVVLITVKGKVAQQAQSVVVIAEPVPVTPPAPPTPPVPTPPPAPADPLLATLQAAYAADPSPTRAADARELAGVFGRAAKDAAINPLTTAGSLVVLAHADAVAKIGQRLPGVRRAVADELNRQVPVAPGAALDADLRARYAAQFGRMATLLGGLH